MPIHSSRGRKFARMADIPPDVVGVGMRDGGRVEAANAARPENGRDDILPHIEGGGMGAGIDSVGPPAPTMPPASMRRVFAMGSDDEEEIALADIDGGDFQGCGAVAGSVVKDCNSGLRQEGPRRRR